MECNGCKGKQEQDEKVSNISFESMKATMERTVKRLWIVILVLIVLFVGTNVFWIWRDSQFETVNETKVTQDVKAENGSAYLSGTGDVIYGQSEANSNGN